jgi:fumarate reductase subunit D
MTGQAGRRIGSFLRYLLLGAGALVAVIVLYVVVLLVGLALGLWHIESR